MGAILNGKKSKAPCQEACPAGIDVPRYIRHLRNGHFTEALDVIRARIPFPFVCGYVCVHPCEAKCSRLQFDEPVAIRMLKRVAAERGGETPARIIKCPPTGKRVAVIGSGPCGLTAAYYLSSRGHAVTIYEALSLPGGILRYGIPKYRLPEGIVDREIFQILAGGIEIHTGTPICSAAGLREKGFDAVLVATGAWKPAKMGIPGEWSPKVIDGLSFLRQVNQGMAPAIGPRVVVVGGGNTAIDASRALVRLGAKVVQLYRRSRAEMLASREEVTEAIEEGVDLQYLSAPVMIEPRQITCIRMRLGEPEVDGRRAPVPVEGSEFTLQFDTMIMAIGQSADAASVHLDGEANGVIRVDQLNLATPQKGVFAGGDAISGPSTIIQAIAQGRLACASIDHFLGGSGNLPESLSEELHTEPPATATRGTMKPATRKISLTRRRTSFDPVELPYGKKTSMAEAARCLSCDLRSFEVTVNGLICKDCGYCQEVCSLSLFEQSADFNPSGYRPAVVVHTGQCVGCLRCLYICPDFAITIQEKKGDLWD